MGDEAAHAAPEVAPHPHALARAGLRGPLQAFPHAARIASAFGGYAPVGIKAAIGGRAALAVRGLDAEAYAFGNRAAFPRYPSLSVAAHEAAHIAAAQRGVTVPGGVGSPGDRHEQVADEAARAVVCGGSAEPIFQQAYGDAPIQLDAAPQLQMYNQIISHNSTLADTPWKQIHDQLGVDTSSYDLGAVMNASGYGSMLKTLGMACQRAESVDAKLDGQRYGGMRTSDPTQTAYGNLGNFMAWVTNTPTPKGGSFEGGHLVSDEILGDYSYVQYNFAPQRSSLNSPYYREIETLAAAGTVDASTDKRSNPWNYRVWLTYDGPTVDVPRTTVMKQLGMTPANITKTPQNVRLTTWVPHIWKARLTAAPGDVFGGVGAIDTAQGSGVGAGFLASEAKVEDKGKSIGGQLPETQRFVDTTHWSMDSMKYVPDPLKPTQIQTGTGLLRENEHTWTGVQSPPRGQSALQGSGPPVIPQTVVLPVPKLPYSFSIKHGWINETTSPPTFLTPKPPPRESWSRRKKRLANEFIKFPGMNKLGIGVSEQAIGLLISAPRPGKYGSTHIGKTKRESIFTPLYLIKKGISRGGNKRKRKGKDAKRMADKQARILPARILFGNLAIDSKPYFDD